MTLAYQRFTAVLLLIYGSLFLSGVYFCLSAFWCAVANNTWILHHDNAPAHTALSVRECLASKQITVLVEHPPYSPDLAPNDFFLFPKMKEILKVSNNTTAALKAIPQISSKIILKSGLGAGIGV
jgi:hypothetical protein